MNREVKLYIAASLDGYIAGPNHELDWLTAYLGPDSDYGYGALYAAIDTTLMGHNTYQEILGFDAFPYPDKVNYVFTRDKGKAPAPYVEFITEDPIAFVRKAQQQAGKDFWLVGGGQLNTLFLNADMIDEIILSVVPEVLGKGVPLFTDLAQHTKFKLQQCESFASGLVQMKLRRR